ncbi:drebrin-like protein [Nerophis ophidion]|uniref:drebrin-like protein n=1 Tax=Nerophis ophidion TaxID=159077 RepID=UPI002ADF8D67|nr:drebrin-like protein [Nerophis ophidion]
MSMQTVNLDTYSLSLLTAKEDILNQRSSTNWALFVYEGLTNKLKLADSGVGGVTELVSKFHASKPQYGLCRLGSGDTGGPRIVMIAWVGEHVEEFRRTECAAHVPAIKHFFKEAHAFISAHKAEDVTEEGIRAELSKTHAPPQWARKSSSRSSEREDIVGTNYRKTNAAMEMRLINRDSFWARAEREEEQRKEEERRRAAEERRRLERERVMKERKDTEERDRKMNEKLRLIEEQRQKQAEQEEVLRRKEKFRWDQERREHEEDMRACLRRSESIEMAAEAAVLVSQRSMNPREFFRQLSSTSSQSPTSPGSSRSGKPFRRYQRSLTDTAFIFSRAEDNTPSSPRSSPLVSPYLRAPPSPIGATSPPTSPVLGPLTSPSATKAALSTPTSPIRDTPPTSATPVVPPPNPQPVVETNAPSPTERSPPPVSFNPEVSFLDTFNTLESHPGVLPLSPPNTPTEPELSTFCFEGPPPQPPTSPLPEVPQSDTDLHTAFLVHTDLHPDTGYKAQAVLLEEDEEEEEEEDGAEEEEVEVNEVEEEEDEEQQQTCASPEEAVRIEPQEHLQEDKEQESELEVELISPVDESEEVQEEDEEEDTEYKEQDEEVEDNQTTDDPVKTSDKAEESHPTDDEHICQTIKLEAVVLPTNGFTNGEQQDHNGLARSLSLSDAEISSPELSGYYDLHNAVESDDAIEEKEISENGQEVLPERQMCVRALYDYQAEDESEISFEPGDIIRDVETVDKAWWRGWSKDGRQGLFPANYVETI